MSLEDRDEEYEFIDAVYRTDENGEINSGFITLKKGDVTIKDAFLGKDAYRVSRMGLKEGDIIVGYLRMVDKLLWDIDVKRKTLEYFGELKYMVIGELIEYIENADEGGYTCTKIDCGVNVWRCVEPEIIERKPEGYYRVGNYYILFGRLDFLPKEGE